MNKEELDGFIFELFTEEIFLINEASDTTGEAKTLTGVKENQATYSTPLKPIVLVISGNDFQTNKDFLEKVFNAVSLTFTDISIVDNIPSNTLEKTTKIIFMGSSPFENGIQNKNFSLYEVSDFEKKLVLQTESANIIQKSTDKKRALWIALQRMFPNVKS